MSDDYCDFSDLPTAMCAHCLGVEDKPGARFQAEAWTNASWSGQCAGCSERIQVGDRIGLVDQVWLHEECFE